METKKITVLTLAGANYSVHGEFTGRQRATTVILAGFEVEAAAVFAAGERRAR